MDVESKILPFIPASKISIVTCADGTEITGAPLNA